MLNCRANGCLRPFTVAFALVLAGIPPAAGTVLAINLPWVRVIGNATSAEVYMELRSGDRATLVAVRSDAAATITIRRPGKGTATITNLPLPAGVSVLLAPGGYRLALTRLAYPLKLGDRVPLTLTIEAGDGSRQEISIDAEVRRRSAIDDHLRPHSH
jgi:copper(I)-binding protein